MRGDCIVRLRTTDPDRLYYPSLRALRGQIATNLTGFEEAVEPRGSFLSSSMATETKPVAAEDPKVDLFEDDDEFEEFEFGEEWDDKEEGKETVQQWEDDWDDDDVNDDFSVQLKKELESSTEKS